MPLPGKAALACAAFLLLTACVSGLPGRARVDLPSWATTHSFAPVSLDTALPLRAMLRVRAGSDTVSVYIEGDGAPWSNAYRPPQDPTPWRPIVMSMAAQEEGRSVAYLARPCQFVEEGISSARAVCQPRLWSEERFSEAIVQAMDLAVSSIKHAAGARHVRLLGYSGGGVVAALLAERRSDVSGLVTIAAPLDLRRWVAHHRISPLASSLDPADFPARVRPYPVLHLVGERDGIVPPEIVSDYGRMRGETVKTVAKAGHECCWAEEWPTLLGLIDEVMQ